MYFNEALYALIKRNYVWSVELVGLEVLGFETTRYGMIPWFTSALSFLGLKEKPKMLIFFPAAYNNMMILLSPAPQQGASSFLQLCYTDICNTLISLGKEKLVKHHCITAVLLVACLLWRVH